MVAPVPDRMDFPKAEEEILKYWKSINAFEESLKKAKGRPRYSFYDGPPFATGLPHYGHILAGTIKDTITRWAAMNGYYVERRFGWDCHGLPVEYEIDKMLNIKGPADVMKIGIAEYNNQCREIVMRYSVEWETIVTRMGRWIDFKNDYKTMYPWFMESVWWVFKQLFEKGMVYKGFKVMPYSTGCNTPLSNFESGQNYKDVSDPAVIVSFPIINNAEEKGASLLAWTTTPWTLPSNLALCVNPNEEYVKVMDKKRRQLFILMEKRLCALYKKEEQYAVLKRYKGTDLSGLEYTPLFKYYAHRVETGAFKVLVDTYVTDSSGTGIVHQAPYFGEDDYRVCLANGVISKDGEIVCPVDASGCFTKPVDDFDGQYVKDADKGLLKKLKDDGRLIDHQTINHSYPFCWRSDTPLIYKAVPSWFVTVEMIVDKLLENNSQTYWVPDFVKEKRFANWLKGARDWAISRNRYWGTPLPIWVSDDGEEIVCIGSIKELEELSGKSIDDIHRESVDDITIPSTQGKGVLRRVTEVFDCWFESGSMPYAQQHYPFERKREFEDSFPADFIAEGIDQTRGWFYTLLVLSTALFGQPPFKNLICNGLILASDGAKMSKRKKNYPEPTLIVDKFGADAVRLYLINSPAVRGDGLRFKEEGVRDVLKDVFLPWFNAYRYLVQNIERLQREENIDFKHDENLWQLTEDYNYMDRWILSFTQSLIKFVRAEMAAYRLYTVVPKLIKFVDNLTNWYVRMNRRRLKGDSGTADCQAAVETLFIVIYSMVKVMASFTPFLAETLYQNLRKAISSGEQEDSVHFLMVPHPREELIDTDIESAVSRMQSVIDLGRVSRDKRTLPGKYPLKEVVVVNEDMDFLRDVDSLRPYILEELNVKSLTTTTDRAAFGVKMEAQGDSKALGIRLKQASKDICKKISEMSHTEICALQEQGYVEISGQRVDVSEVRIKLIVEHSNNSNYEANSDWQALVLLDCTVDEEAKSEGLAREVTNRIQKLRKEAGLQPNDEISIYYEADKVLVEVVEQNQELIHTAIKQPLLNKEPSKSDKVIITWEDKVKDYKLKVTITARGNTMVSSFSGNSQAKQLKYCNISKDDQTATVVLERPIGSGSFITYGCLCNLTKEIFELKQRPRLYHGSSEVTSSHSVADLHGSLLTVGQGSTKATSNGAACKIVYASNGNDVLAIVSENPVGKNCLDKSQLEKRLNNSDSVYKLYADIKLTTPL